MPSSSPHPTIAAGWAPTGAGCHAKEDFWIWDYHSDNDMRTVLGGPSQLDESATCYPSSWVPTYAATKCPNGYTRACPPASPTGPVTCCPTVYSFSCVDNANSQPHGSWFPCMMNFATSRDVTVTRTDFVSNKITFQKTPLKTDLHLFAVGLVYATPTATNADSTATATETTSSTSTSTSEPSRTDESSISGGAAAGIGIGSAAGVVFIAILAWFIYRRRQASRIMASRGNEYRGAQYDMKSLPGSAHPRELDAQRPTQQFLGELAG